MTKHNDQERSLFNAWWGDFSLAARMNGALITDALAWSAWQARAQLPTTGGAVPEGYALVPIIPTQEQNDAGRAVLVAGAVPLTKVYRAMLATAPHPVSGEQKAVAPTIRDFADCVKQLCKDFSDLRDRPYMGDVTAAIDGLYDELMNSDAMMEAAAFSIINQPAEKIDDGQFVDEFMTWWEDHGQYVRSGGGDYERTFAFQAWRHLMPTVFAYRAIGAHRARQVDR